MGIPNRGQDRTEAGDKEGIKINHVSVSTDSSEYLSNSNFEQDLSNIKANASSQELNEASSGLRKTEKCLAVSLSGKPSSAPRKAGAITTAE